MRYIILALVLAVGVGFAKPHQETFEKRMPAKATVEFYRELAVLKAARTEAASDQAAKALIQAEIDALEAMR